MCFCMYIQDCPIPFHDPSEACEFLLALPPRLAFMFDGKRLFNRTIRFFCRGTDTYLFFTK